MTIRTGNYTIYRENICLIFEIRHELELTQEDIQYQICSNFQMDGFEKHPFENLFCKVFNFSDITNAFLVDTFGLYKGIEVNVYEFRPNPRMVHITTKDKSIATNLSFIDMGDYYLKEIDIDELEKIWEKINSSNYPFPMPDSCTCSAIAE